MIVPCLTMFPRVATSVCAGRRFAPGETGLLAIINRTPDSFYDAGRYLDDEVALSAVARAVADGADAVDVGGVKAGPGPEVSAAEELRRVVPFIEAVRAAHPDLVISVDTWRPALPMPPATSAQTWSTMPGQVTTPSCRRSRALMVWATCALTPVAIRRAPTRTGCATTTSSPRPSRT
jgi:dihydropteroate synthase